MERHTWNTATNWDNNQAESLVAHAGGQHETVIPAPVDVGDVVAYWPLREPAGASTAYDYAGDEDGSITGPVTFEYDGRVGPAYRIDDGGRSVQLSHSSAFEFTDYTISFWIKDVDGHSGSWDRVLLFGSGATGDGRWPLISWHANTDGAFHWMHTLESKDNWGAAVSNLTTPQGTWTWWCGTFDVDGNFRLYRGLDGTLELSDEKSVPSGWSRNFTTTSHGFYGHGERRNGLQHVVLDNSAWSQSKVQAVYDRYVNGWAGSLTTAESE